MKTKSIDLILKYLGGNITPNELEKAMPELTHVQCHKLAIFRLAYENYKAV